FFICHFLNPDTIKPELLTQSPIPDTTVVPELELLPLVEYQQSISHQTQDPSSTSLLEADESPSSHRPVRKRTSRLLKYYDDFVCTKIFDNQNQDSIAREDDEECSSISIEPQKRKRTRIVLKKENDDTDNLFACHLCPKKYDQQFYLNRHLT